MNLQFLKMMIDQKLKIPCDVNESQKVFNFLVVFSRISGEVERSSPSLNRNTDVKFGAILTNNEAALVKTMSDQQPIHAT